MKLLATIVSYVLHPLLMPLYVILLFWEMNNRAHFYPGNEVWMYILLVVLINTLLLPVIMFLMMKKLNIIRSLEMEHRSDRLYPFVITGIFYLTSWFVFRSLSILDIITFMFVVSALLVLVAAIVNLFWKISIHAMSLGAMAVFIIFLTSVHFINTNWPAYLVVLISGLVGWARLTLKTHSPAQVYVGYLTGGIITSVFLAGLS